MDALAAARKERGLDSEENLATEFDPEVFVDQ